MAVPIALARAMFAAWRERPDSTTATRTDGVRATVVDAVRDRAGDQTGSAE